MRALFLTGALLVASSASAEVKHSVLASEIVRAVEQRDPDLFRDVISERSTLAAGYERGEDVTPQRIFTELAGCHVSEVMEANRSPNVVVGGEPRVWWVCSQRKPIGCMDIGYIGSFWEDEDGRVFRLKKDTPRNLKRCPLNSPGPVIPNG